MLESLKRPMRVPSHSQVAGRDARSSTELNSDLTARVGASL